MPPSFFPIFIFFSPTCVLFAARSRGNRCNNKYPLCGCHTRLSGKARAASGGGTPSMRYRRHHHHRRSYIIARCTPSKTYPRGNRPAAPPCTYTYMCVSVSVCIMCTGSPPRLSYRSYRAVRNLCADDRPRVCRTRCRHRRTPVPNIQSLSPSQPPSPPYVWLCARHQPDAAQCRRPTARTASFVHAFVIISF